MSKTQYEQYKKVLAMAAKEVAQLQPALYAVLQEMTEEERIKVEQQEKIQAQGESLIQQAKLQDRELINNLQKKFEYLEYNLRCTHLLEEIAEMNALQLELINEKKNSVILTTQERDLSSQLPIVKGSFIDVKDNLQQVQAKIMNQEIFRQKLQSYLDDYQEPSISESSNDDQLINRLLGQLDTPNME